jgi:hypothetical protein
MAYKKITNKENALKLINGTSLKDRLVGFNYKQLVAAFGEPTFNSPSDDSKVQKEWVFQRKSDGAVFTLYDWKTYDVNQTENFLQTWNVGGHSYAGEFVNELIIQLKKKN